MTDADHPSAPSDRGDLDRTSASPPVPTHIITIPTSFPMVTLLGPRDELLRTIERAFPLLDVHVRGNEISLRGVSSEVALVERLVDELLVIIDAGQPLNRDAVERSISMLRSQTRERPADVLTMIILTCPAVEAGERLGFLPGTLNDKIDPYLRPLYDALHDMVDPDSIPRLMAAGTIEVAPLAYMRGRSLNDSFIILDEAQNTSAEQMKMF